MRWSAAVKRLEPLLADSVRGHIGFHATRYRHAHDFEGRAWITWDGAQIASFDSIPHLARVYGLAEELKVLGPDIGDAWDQARAIASLESMFAMEDFTSAVERYPSVPFSDAIDSPNPIVQGLAFLDRRLGKRRIDRLSKDRLLHPFTRKLANIRISAEAAASAVSKTPVASPL